MPPRAPAGAPAAAGLAARCAAAARGAAAAAPRAPQPGRRAAQPCRCLDASRRPDAPPPPPPRGAARTNGPPAARARAAPAPRAPPRSASAAEEDERVLLSRSQLLSKNVITRTSGANLGVVTQARAAARRTRAGGPRSAAAALRRPAPNKPSPLRQRPTPHTPAARPPRPQLWVDVGAWEVLALDVRAPGALGGARDAVLLPSLRQVGDVLLVHDERALAPAWAPTGALPVVGTDLVTQAGAYLGRVRDFEFDPEDGSVTSLLFDAFGLPLLPEEALSVYALPIGEVVSAGAERIVVRAGAEARLRQLSASLLQRWGLLEPPWEEALRAAEQEDAYGRRERYDSRYDGRYERYGGRYDGAGVASSSYGYEEQQGAYRDGAARPRRADARAGAREGESARARRREEEERAPQPSREGIPLLRRAAPYERRDADGRYGDAAAAAAAAARARDAAGRPSYYAATRDGDGGDDVAEAPPRAFDAWVAREPVRERESAGGGRGGGGAAYDALEDML
jgi:sporulation protein YlmC with PRC-barrel domain